MVRSLISVSARSGLADETIVRNTYDKNTYMFIRLRGRGGAFDPVNRIHLKVTLTVAECAALLPITVAGGGAQVLTTGAGPFRTIIAIDRSRLTTTATSGSAAAAAEQQALLTSLQSLAARPEVAGVVVDVGSDARVRAANVQADANPGSGTRATSTRR